MPFPQEATEPVASVGLPDAIDRSVLEEITGGDAQQARELLDEFVTTAQGDIAALEQALARRDRTSAAREAHRIKGAARLVGATALADQAAAIEARLRSGAGDDFPDPFALHAALAALSPH